METTFKSTTINNERIMEKVNEICSMSNYLLFKTNLNTLKMISENEIPLHYYKYIPLYEKYLKMRASGMKKDYIIITLSEEFEVSDSTIKRVVSVFSRKVTT